MKESSYIMERPYSEMIEHIKSLVSDCIPYDDPDYDRKLTELAEGIIHYMHHPEDMYADFAARTRTIPDNPEDDELPF